MRTVETAMANLKDLAEVSKRLNAQSNQVNQILQGFEDKLVEMNLGVEVWLEHYPLSETPHNFFDGDKEEEVRRKTATVLGFAKFGDRFLLLVKNVEYDWTGRNMHGDHWSKMNDGERKPLLQASREVRIEAMGKIEALIDAMLDQGKQILTSIDKGQKAVENLKNL